MFRSSQIFKNQKNTKIKKKILKRNIWCRIVFIYRYGPENFIHISVLLVFKEFLWWFELVHQINKFVHSTWPLTLKIRNNKLISLQKHFHITLYSLLLLLVILNRTLIYPITWKIIYLFYLLFYLLYVSFVLNYSLNLFIIIAYWTSYSFVVVRSIIFMMAPFNLFVIIIRDYEK